jgi:uncharacterized iron-regulated membrane protein
MNIHTKKAQEGTATAIQDRFYIAAWRWHFYAGLYVAPFLIMLAITGLMMLHIANFDGRDGGRITIPPQGEMHSLTNLQQKVESTYPNATLLEWIGGRAPDQAMLFRIEENGAQTMVAINPYTTDILETWERRNGWYDFADNVHGTLLLGDFGDRLIEIAAGFGLILVITGIYMWWPRDKSLAQSLKIDLSLKKRNLIKSLHQGIGFYSVILLVFFLLSGMAWTGIWGGKFVQAWSTFPAYKWSAPLSQETHEGMNHGSTKDVPWALEQTPMPKSGSDVGTPALEPGEITLESVKNYANALGFQNRFHINLPKNKEGVWTLSQDSMSNDSENPWGDRTMHIDQFSGKILADVQYKDYSVAGKTMAVGISFHMGTMGLWNIILNTLFCLATIFLAISGIIMWWMRRPSKAKRLVAPNFGSELPMWKGAAFLMLFVAMAFPLVGITLLGLLLVDMFIIQKIKPLAKAMS